MSCLSVCSGFVVLGWSPGCFQCIVSFMVLSSVFCFALSYFVTYLAQSRVVSQTFFFCVSLLCGFIRLALSTLFFCLVTFVQVGCCLENVSILILIFKVSCDLSSLRFFLWDLIKVSRHVDFVS